MQAQQHTVAAWRAAHERPIVDELLQLVSLPNVAGVDDLAANAKLLETLFTRRGFKVEQFAGTGSPVVFASLDVPSPRAMPQPSVAAPATVRIRCWRTPLPRRRQA